MRRCPSRSAELCRKPWWIGAPCVPANGTSACCAMRGCGRLKRPSSSFRPFAGMIMPKSPPLPRHGRKASRPIRTLLPVHPCNVMPERMVSPLLSLFPLGQRKVDLSYEPNRRPSGKRVAAHAGECGAAGLPVLMCCAIEVGEGGRCVACSPSLRPGERSYPVAPSAPDQPTAMRAMLRAPRPASSTQLTCTSLARSSRRKKTW